MFLFIKIYFANRKAIFRSTMLERSVTFYQCNYLVRNFILERYIIRDWFSGSMFKSGASNRLASKSASVKINMPQNPRFWSLLSHKDCKLKSLQMPRDCCPLYLQFQQNYVTIKIWNCTQYHRTIFMMTFNDGLSSLFGLPPLNPAFLLISRPVALSQKENSEFLFFSD